MSPGALEALDEILDHAEDADDALRETVRILAAEPEISWAGILFLDDGSLTRGPVAGTPDESRRTTTPIVYQGTTVGELLVDGDPDATLLEHVAARIAAHVLIGWDTGGETWEP